LLLGDVGAATETAALAAQLEPDTAAPWRPIVTNALGMTAYWSGATDKAIQSFQETVSAGKAVSNHTAAIYALGYLAAISAERAEYSEARELVDSALSLARRHDLDEHWVTVMAHYAAGECAGARGDLIGARAAIERGLDLARRGGLRLDTVYGLLALVALARAEGYRGEAAELYGRAERQLAACSEPGILRDRLERVQRVAARPSRARPIADELSERELAVLRLMPTQLSLRQIGNELYVSLNTAKTHARNIYAKLRVSSRAEAVSRARQLHLL
jgi:LuxR family maltose regulon positive regulatory protein